MKSGLLMKEGGNRISSFGKLLLLPSQTPLARVWIKIHEWESVCSANELRIGQNFCNGSSRKVDPTRGSATRIVWVQCGTGMLVYFLMAGRGGFGTGIDVFMFIRAMNTMNRAKVQVVRIERACRNFPILLGNGAAQVVLS